MWKIENKIQKFFAPPLLQPATPAEAGFNTDNPNRIISMLIRNAISDFNITDYALRSKILQFCPELPLPGTGIHQFTPQEAHVLSTLIDRFNIPQMPVEYIRPVPFGHIPFVTTRDRTLQRSEALAEVRFAQQSLPEHSILRRNLGAFIDTLLTPTPISAEQSTAPIRSYGSFDPVSHRWQPEIPPKF